MMSYKIRNIWDLHLTCNLSDLVYPPPHAAYVQFTLRDLVSHPVPCNGTSCNMMHMLQFTDVIWYPPHVACNMMHMLQFTWRDLVSPHVACNMMHMLQFTWRDLVSTPHVACNMMHILQFTWRDLVSPPHVACYDISSNMMHMLQSVSYVHTVCSIVLSPLTPPPL